MHGIGVIRDIRGRLMARHQPMCRQHDERAQRRAHRAGQLSGVADLVGHGGWLIAGLLANCEIRGNWRAVD